MERNLYNACLTLFNAIREGQMDGLGMTEDNLSIMEQELNLVLESHAPKTYDPDQQEAEMIQGWQGLDEDDGQPMEWEEWRDFDPDC